MNQETWEDRFDKQFKCIDKNCDSRGNIPTYDEQGDVIAEQCQFCFEYLFPLKQFFQKELNNLAKELYAVAINNTKLSNEQMNMVRALRKTLSNKGIKVE